jgi:hypothetical protein
MGQVPCHCWASLRKPHGSFLLWPPSVRTIPQSRAHRLRRTRPHPSFDLIRISARLGGRAPARSATSARTRYLRGWESCGGIERAGRVEKPASLQHEEDPKPHLTPSASGRTNSIQRGGTKTLIFRSRWRAPAKAPSSTSRPMLKRLGIPGILERSLARRYGASDRMYRRRSLRGRDQCPDFHCCSLDDL